MSEFHIKGTSASVLVDAATGSPPAKSTLLSRYPSPGLRFLSRRFSVPSRDAFKENYSPAPVYRNVRGAAIPEFDVQWRKMRPKRDARRFFLLAFFICEA